MSQANTNPRQPQEDNPFDQRVLAVDRVARVVKGGRRFRFRALVVLGDNKGKVGVGSSKGQDVTMAINKAADIAKKNMTKVNLEEGTIPHMSKAKVGGSQILIMPAAEGTGLIAGSVVREILEATGIRNIRSKSLGNNNKTNSAYATVDALKQLAPRKSWVTNQKTDKKVGK